MPLFVTPPGNLPGSSEAAATRAETGSAPFETFLDPSAARGIAPLVTEGTNGAEEPGSLLDRALADWKD